MIKILTKNFQNKCDSSADVYSRLPTPYNCMTFQFISFNFLLFSFGIHYQTEFSQLSICFLKWKNRGHNCLLSSVQKVRYLPGKPAVHDCIVMFLFYFAYNQVLSDICKLNFWFWWLFSITIWNVKKFICFSPTKRKLQFPLKLFFWLSPGQMTGCTIVYVLLL